jgi:hypothetical protein
VRLAISLVLVCALRTGALNAQTSPQAAPAGLPHLQKNGQTIQRAVTDRTYPMNLRLETCSRTA